MQICFFEDALSSGLKPLTLTRPADELRIGALKINEKWKLRLRPVNTTRILAPYMEGVYDTPDLEEDTECVWINGRYLPETGIEALIGGLKPDEGLTFKNIPVIVKMTSSRSRGQLNAGTFSTAETSFEETELGALLTNSWQVFTENANEINKDLELLRDGLFPVDPGKFPGVHFSDPANVFIGSDVSIEPGTVILADPGPVILKDHSHVMAGSLLRGPMVLGEHAVLKMGAKIYEGTTIGPWCKIGGEVNNVVFQAYSNKAHDGFLGNSAVGEWCNFGADTNNSNLKNNYSLVRLPDWENGREIETGLQFCGLIMGDHSKTSINSMLNTGTVCGVSSNIFSGNFPKKLIRSFRWVGSGGEEIYKFDKAMEAAEKMMGRRGVELSPEYRKMMRHLFEKSNR